MPDYGFYTAVYGGELPETEFGRFRGRACACLAALTMGRSCGPLPPHIKNCVDMTACALVEAMHKVENGGDIVSESNDGISVTYAAKAQQTDEKRFYDVVAGQLAWTGLLYRGCL